MVFRRERYATEEVILEVELEVGVLLDGAEDLAYVLEDDGDWFTDHCE